MKHAIAIALSLLVASTASAQQFIKKGASDRNTYIRIVDEADGTPETGVVAATAGLDLEYIRDGAAPVNLTEIDLAAIDSVHADGGIKHAGYGLYRLCLPDAAFASGVDSVIVTGGATGMVVIPARIQLTEFDISATLPIDQVPVPESRTWIPTRTSTGLVAKLPIGIRIGEPDVYAIDFRHDLANNGRLIDFDSIAILTGTAGGVTFDASRKVDKVQAKVKITPVTPGTYTLKAIATKDDSDGAGKSVAIVTLIVN